ncbi:MAG TPA: DUF5666 domain-containing protein [Acidimicrobiales bacterium]|nr:DUF5666 domain-containing protein [Acidimicrobiales bacterium]
MAGSFFRNRAVKVGGASALMAGLMAGGYGVASAATGGSGPSTQASSGTPGGHFRPDGPGGHRPGGGGAGGSITALGTKSFTVKTPGGSSETVNTTNSTTYTRDGASSTASALAVGEHVRVRPAQSSTNASSTLTAAAVDIMDPAIHGTVESVSGNTLTIVDEQGFWRTVNLSATSTYTDNGNSSSASALSNGGTVVAFGSVDADHASLDATSVAINPTHGGPEMGVPGPQA